MNPVILPAVYLARHGETAWKLTGQHTGLSDLPLTERGERNARRLKERLAGASFAKSSRAVCNARLARATWPASGNAAEADRDLVEWNTEDRRASNDGDSFERPDWQLFRDGCPDGESPNQVGDRADRVLSRVRAINGEC